MLRLRGTTGSQSCFDLADWLLSLEFHGELHQVLTGLIVPMVQSQEHAADRHAASGADGWFGHSAAVDRSGLAIPFHTTGWESRCPIGADQPRSAGPAGRASAQG